MGGDGYGHLVYNGHLVSIHTPAWGATNSTLRMTSGRRCFNPHPRVGGDGDSAEETLAGLLFQSTPPRGGRPVLEFADDQPLHVSIHTPAWGATIASLVFQTVYMFQSTPPRGGRQSALQMLQRVTLFQSTPPRGGRHEKTEEAEKMLQFQSTPPRGGRLPVTAIAAVSNQVSIHTPAWGATNRQQGHCQG